MAKKVDELPVYQRAVEFELAINAILHGPGLRRDFKHRGQIVSATESIQANIEEGFEQGTDAAFARYLEISKGSAGEVIGHLRRANRKRYVTDADAENLIGKAEEICRMLGGFIKYLRQSNFKDRGRHNQPGPEDPDASHY